MRGSSGDGPSRFYLHLLERGEPIHQGVYDMTENKMVAYLSRLKRLLACVFIGALISFAVYLFKLQNKSESIAKGEVGESDFHEARIVDLKWDREIREIPDSLASLRKNFLPSHALKLLAKSRCFYVKEKIGKPV